MARTTKPGEVKNSLKKGLAGLSTEIGAAGHAWSSQGNYESEFLRELIGQEGIKRYRRMSNNDPTIGAILFAVEQMMKSVKYDMDANPMGGASAEEHRDFAHSVYFEDMLTSWDDFLDSCLSFMPFGWSLFEEVYKLRRGWDNKNPRKSSKFDDGRIGLAKLAFRPQNTLHEWVYRENDDLLGMHQIKVDNHGSTGQVFIPTSKCLHFKAKNIDGGHPEGRSVLRNAYVPWFYLTNIQEVEAIAIERDLAGLPVFKIPSKYLSADATEEEKEIRAVYEKAAKNVKLNNQGGLVIPSDPFLDANGNLSQHLKVVFELVSSNGKRTIDIRGTIEGYQRDIARTMMADFLLLGSDDRGSFALSESKTDLFLSTIDGFTEKILEVFNKVSIPRLWAYNGLPRETMPKMTASKINSIPQDILAGIIDKLAKAGMPFFPDTKTENAIRERLDLPEAQVDLTR